MFSILPSLPLSFTHFFDNNLPVFFIALGKFIFVGSFQIQYNWKHLSKITGEICAFFLKKRLFFSQRSKQKKNDNRSENILPLDFCRSSFWEFKKRNIQTSKRIYTKVKNEILIANNENEIKSKIICVAVKLLFYWWNRECPQNDWILNRRKFFVLFVCMRAIYFASIWQIICLMNYSKKTIEKIS